MQKKIILILFILGFLGCKPKSEVSEIEVTILDTAFVTEIKQSSDSFTVKPMGGQNTELIYTYYKGKEYRDNIVTTLGDTVVGLIRKKDGVNYFVCEYYTNGQVIGYINLSSEGKINGKAKYYYQDGRIRTTGEWRNTKRVGVWKDYDEEGKLVSIYDHDKDEYIYQRTKPDN